MNAGSLARERAAEAQARRRAERRRRHQRIEAAAARREAAAKKAAAQVVPSVHLRSLVPSTASADDGHSAILLGAAGVLLALVLASGTLFSLGSRVMKGQLR